MESCLLREMVGGLHPRPGFTAGSDLSFCAMSHRWNVLSASMTRFGMTWRQISRWSSTGSAWMRCPSIVVAWLLLGPPISLLRRLDLRRVEKKRKKKEVGNAGEVLSKIAVLLPGMRVPTVPGCGAQWGGGARSILFIGFGGVFTPKPQGTTTHLLNLIDLVQNSAAGVLRASTVAPAPNNPHCLSTSLQVSSRHLPYIRVRTREPGYSTYIAPW